METAAYDVRAPKRRANVTVNSDLLGQAKELGIGLSAELEAALARRVREERRRLWLERNRGAIADANAFVDRHGLPLDEYRQF